MEDKKKGFGILHNISAIGQPALSMSASSSAVKDTYRLTTAFKYELRNLKWIGL